MDELTDVTEPYQTLFENLMDTLPGILAALVILLLFSYIAWKISRLIGRGFRGGRASLVRILFQRIVFGLILLFGVILVLPIFGYTQIATFFLAGGSLFAIVFGIAFRDIGQNILSGILLALNRPFEIGDLVALENFEGHVISLNLRNTHIRTYDGRDVFIANSSLIQNPLVNYTRDGLRRFTFEVGLDYSNDAEKARRCIGQTLEAIEEVLEEPQPSVNVEELGTNAVIIRAHYWLDMFLLDPNLFEIRSTVVNRTKETLLEEGFDLPAEIVELQNADPTQPFRIQNQTGSE